MRISDWSSDVCSSDLLAIDSGNTNVVFAVYEGDALRGAWRCASNPKRTADEYAVWLTQLMGLEQIEPKHIDAIIMANVVPQARFNLIALCHRYFGQEPLIVGEEGVDLGMKALIERPEQVGADRKSTRLKSSH